MIENRNSYLNNNATSYASTSISSQTGGPSLSTDLAEAIGKSIDELKKSVNQMGWSKKIDEYSAVLNKVDEVSKNAWNARGISHDQQSGFQAQLKYLKLECFRDVVTKATEGQSNPAGSLLSSAFSFNSTVPDSVAAGEFLDFCLEFLISKNCNLNEFFMVEPYKQAMPLVELGIAFGLPSSAFRVLAEKGVDLVRRNNEGKSFIQAYSNEGFLFFLNNISRYASLFEVTNGWLINNKDKHSYVLLDRLSCYGYDVDQKKWRANDLHIKAAHCLIGVGANPLLSRKLPLYFSKNIIFNICNRKPDAEGSDQIYDYLALLENTIDEGHFLKKHGGNVKPRDVAIEICHEMQFSQDKSKVASINRSIWGSNFLLFDVLEHLQTNFIFCNKIFPVPSLRNYGIVMGQSSLVIGFMATSNEIRTSDEIRSVSSNGNFQLRTGQYEITCSFYSCNAYEARFGVGDFNMPPPTLPYTVFPKPWGNVLKHEETFQVSTNNSLFKASR